MTIAFIFFYIRSDFFSRKINLSVLVHRKKAIGGGTILDMGVYTIQACQWVLEKEPISIKAKGSLNEEGVDVEMSAELDYGDEKKVRISTSALNQLSNSVEIVGTNGKITVNFISYLIFFTFSSVFFLNFKLITNQFYSRNFVLRFIKSSAQQRSLTLMERSTIGHCRLPNMISIIRTAVA